jgi:hypothetical protein
MKNLYNQNLKLQVGEKKEKEPISNEQNRPLKCQLLISKHKVGVIFIKVDKLLCVSLYIHMMCIVEYTKKM